MLYYFIFACFIIYTTVFINNNSAYIKKQSQYLFDIMTIFKHIYDQLIGMVCVLIQFSILILNISFMIFQLFVSLQMNICFYMYNILFSILTYIMNYLAETINDDKKEVKTEPPRPEPVQPPPSPTPPYPIEPRRMRTKIV